jgi:hypothetical protein
LEDDTSEGYGISNARIPILLALKRITELKPHEQTVPEDLSQLVLALRRDPVLRHPLIADKETGLILDGTHRLAALTELGCRLVPCALVNYNDPKIRVERWFRIVLGRSLREFASRIVGAVPETKSTREAEECLATRRCYASLEDEHLCLVLTSPDANSASMARRAFQIEETAREGGMKVSYSDNKSFPLKQGPGFFVSTIRIEKPEVIGSALEGAFFPPKTTRHIIPSRPLGINLPVEWLNEENVSKANSRFIEHLRTKKVKRLPQGSWVGSRRYQEEVFMFE